MRTVAGMELMRSISDGQAPASVHARFASAIPSPGGARSSSPVPFARHVRPRLRGYSSGAGSRWSEGAAGGAGGAARQKNFARGNSQRSVVEAHMPRAIRHLADWREDLFVLVPNKPPSDGKEKNSGGNTAPQSKLVGDQASVSRSTAGRPRLSSTGGATEMRGAAADGLQDPRDVGLRGGPGSISPRDIEAATGGGGMIMDSADGTEFITEVAKTDYSDRAKYLCNMKRVELSFLRYSMILETVNDEGQKTGPGPDLVLPLWQSKFSRRIRLMMALTMYAEEPEELKKTLYGVAENVDALVRAGELDWDQVCVTLVTDGLSRANEKTLQWMESLNMYNSDVIDWASQRWGVNKSDASVHCFESTVQLAKEDDAAVYHYPLQMVFFAKQNNAGKLDSQRWAFYGLFDFIMPLMKKERTELLELEGKEVELLYLGDAAKCLSGNSVSNSRLECAYNRWHSDGDYRCDDPILSGTPCWYATTGGEDNVCLHPTCFNRIRTAQKAARRTSRSLHRLKTGIHRRRQSLTVLKALQSSSHPDGAAAPATAAPDTAPTDVAIEMAESHVTPEVEEKETSPDAETKETTPGADTNAATATGDKDASEAAEDGGSESGVASSEVRDKFPSVAGAESGRGVGATEEKLGDTWQHTTDESLEALKAQLESEAVPFLDENGNYKPYFSYAVQSNQGVPDRIDPAPGLDDGTPEYFIQLIDVGTRPLKDAIMKLYITMKENPQIAGCCGEIESEDIGILNPVVGAQNFEYKISHCMDKAMESVFGYITVLPGAFSAYRYNAIRRDQLVPDARDRHVEHLSKTGPLVEYFKSLSPSPEAQTPMAQNMYLAEDRILCFALVAMENKNWLLRYVKDSVATTDVPTSLVDLIKQRRRWLNGALFAMLYALGRFKLIWTQSSHSFFRKVALSFQFLYFLVNTVMSWFLIGSFYITFLLILNAMLDDADGPSKLLRYGLTFLYLLTTTGQFLVALGNKPHEVRALYTLSALLYGAMSLAATLLGVLGLFEGSTPSIHVLLAMILITGSVFLCAVLHGELRRVLVTFFHYFLLIPTTINILQVYSVCRVDDVSWGTKGLETVNHGGGPGAVGRITSRKKRKEMERRAKIAAKEAQQAQDQREASFRQFRSYVVVALLSTNYILVTGVFAFKNVDLYVVTLAYTVVFLLGVRVTGSVMFIVLHWLHKARRAVRVPQCLRICARKTQDHLLVPCKCIDRNDELEMAHQAGVRYAQRDCCLHPRCMCCLRFRCGCCKMQETKGRPTAWMSGEKLRLEKIEFREIIETEHIVSHAVLEAEDDAEPVVESAGDDALDEIAEAYQKLATYIRERDAAAERFEKHHDAWGKRAKFTKASVEALRAAMETIEARKDELLPELEKKQQ